MEPLAPRLATSDDAGIEAELYLPRAAGPFELCVIVLGGTAGGLGHRDSAQALAQNGIPALALAYFNHGKLPGKLERIALEYFERAGQWLRRCAELERARLVLMGRSRGAELCLQLGATYPQFEGVIATSPSHVLWPGMGRDVPAWTLGGEPLPAVQNRSQAAPDPEFEVVDGKRYLILNQGSFQLRDNPTVEAATIAVENINGPVLLFAGRDDRLWPSSFFADQIEQRASSRGFRFPLQNVQYDGVGHDIPLPGQPPALRAAYPGASTGVSYGGVAELAERAADDRWRRILEFLRAAGARPASHD